MPTSRKRKKKTNKKKRHPSRNDVLDGAYNRMTQKMRKDGIKSRISRVPHKHRISELLMDFLSENYKTCTTEREERRLISLGIICWNIANFNKEQREEQLQQALDKIETDMGISDIMEPIMRDLVNKKVKHYNKYKYLITNYDISYLPNGQLHLSVASAKID